MLYQKQTLAELLLTLALRLRNDESVGDSQLIDDNLILASLITLLPV